MAGFASYASHLLNSTGPSPQPLFYSTRDSFIPFAHEDDILGGSIETEDDRQEQGRRLSFGSGDSRDDGEEQPPPPTASVLGIPAFMSKLSQAPARFSRGWRAHDSESVLPQSQVYLDYSDDGSDQNSPPGAFLSAPLPPPSASNEPLLPPRTFFVYPVPGQTNGVGAQAEYRDSGWIVAYGLAVIAVFLLGIREWWDSPVKSSPSIPSIFSTIPILLTLSLISLVAGASIASYIVAVRHGMRHFINAVLVGGPLVFVVCGVVAFAGSLGGSGAAGDSGWKSGMRWFAFACFVISFVLARAAISRRKQVARACAIGELATQTILEHPPLILLCLTLSVLSTVVALPFLFLLAGLLFDTASSPTFGIASWGSLLTLLVYTWSLAILRGLQHVVVGGVVGTWYFEREDSSCPGAFQVTRAALKRATHQSLGTVIFASAISALATTTTTLLKSANSTLRSKHLHPLLQPLTYLVPLFTLITGAITAFNSYALTYAGMTGERYLTSGREVAKTLRANRTGGLGDSLLVRLVLFVTSLAWGLLSGLTAFLIASGRLESGGKLAPFVAVLCFFVPLWTMKLCHDVCGDTVDTLFLCMNIDLQRNTSHCPKAVEAFGVADREPESFA